VVSGIGFAYIKHVDSQNQDRLAETGQQLTARLAETGHQLTVLQQTQERDQKRFEMLPSALNMLRENKCDTDLTAMILLEELRGFGADRRLSASPVFDKSHSFTPYDADVGTVAERATLALLLSRQSASQKARQLYCTCEALNAIGNLTKEGKDKRIAELAGQLAEKGLEAGGPCVAGSSQRKVLAEAAQNLSQGGYYVVFSNDDTCDAAQFECGKVLIGLKKSSSELPNLMKGFKPELVRIRQGVVHGQTNFVTTYGGDLTIAVASDLVNALAGKGDFHRDLYWTKKAFRADAACKCDSRAEPLATQSGPLNSDQQQQLTDLEAGRLSDLKLSFGIKPASSTDHWEYITSDYSLTPEKQAPKWELKHGKAKNHGGNPITGYWIFQPNQKPRRAWQCKKDELLAVWKEDGDEDSSEPAGWELFQFKIIDKTQGIILARSAYYEDPRFLRFDAASGQFWCDRNNTELRVKF